MQSALLAQGDLFAAPPPSTFDFDVCSPAMLDEYAANARGMTPAAQRALAHELQNRAASPTIPLAFVTFTGIGWAVVVRGTALLSDPDTGRAFDRPSATTYARRVQAEGGA